MAGTTRSNASSNASSSARSGGRRGDSGVVDHGRRKTSCGYCKSGARSSISHGLWAHSLTVDDYQDLLDRGWRRSGAFLYKPEMARTCCPSYTIRLRASDFVPSKEQVRVFRKMQRFLDGKLDCKKPTEHIADPKAYDMPSCVHNETSSSVERLSPSCKTEHQNEAEHYMQHLCDLINNAVGMCIESGEFPRTIPFPRASVKKVSQERRKLPMEVSKNLQYTTNIAFLIVSTIERAQVGDEPKSSKENALHPKIVAEKLATLLSQIEEFSCLSIKACNGHINFYSAEQAILPESVTDSIPKESSKKVGSKRCNMEVSSDCVQKKRQKLEVLLKRSSFDPEEYELYRRYQIKVHNDTPDRVTESSYRRFLVDTPLIFVPPASSGSVPSCGFGSFHQQYIIDGRLVAVGVIDILPKCLSSKYLFWDPDFAFLSLGKYSALQEIDWVKDNQVHCTSLQYYYLGYYIHSCRKMRYKAAYYPSELLCPLRYQWVQFDIAKPLLDKKPYVVLSDYSILQNEVTSPNCSENIMELKGNDVLREETKDCDVEENREVFYSDFDSSDDESDPETSCHASSEIDDGDVSNILIGLRGSRLVRYKDLKQASDPKERNYLENQLRRYKKVVGTELSEKIILSLW